MVVAGRNKQRITPKCIIKNKGGQAEVRRTSMKNCFLETEHINKVCMLSLTSDPEKES